MIGLGDGCYDKEDQQNQSDYRGKSDQSPDYEINGQGRAWPSCDHLANRSFQALKTAEASPEKSVLLNNP